METSYTEYARKRDATIRRLGGTPAMGKPLLEKQLELMRESLRDQGYPVTDLQKAKFAGYEQAIIDLQARFIDDGESEQCQRCLNLVDLVWYAPDEIWERVTGITDGSGIYCVHCFSEMAWKVDMSLYWECAEDRFPTLFSWIPTTKALPAKGVPVLAWIGYTTAVLCLCNDVWYYAHNGQTYGALCAVTHWMHLPEAP